MKERRVVITGMGAVTCAGNNWPATWEALCSGRGGIGPLTRCPAAGLPGAAGEVREFELRGATPRERRRIPRCGQFAVAAAEEALTAAGLSADPAEREGDPYRFGALVASGVGAVEEYEENFRILSERGPGGVSPLLLPKFIVNSVSAAVAMRFGLRGPNYAPVSACASGAHAVGEAMWVIRRGDADLMLAGGSEACITPLMLHGFNAMTALSHIAPPERASRPFDRDRNGFVMSEGAAVLVLEELEHARCRGAEILAEVVGYGATCDAWHIAAPLADGSGMARAIGAALEHAGCPPEAVGCAFAHGTGTIANDRAEAAALHRVFGAHTDRLRVSAVKSALGHALSAAGAIAAAAATAALRTGIVPPTLNLEHPDPECGLNLVSGAAETLDDLRYALVDSLGFGGHNAALICKKWEES